jgi:hypothetical protein
MSPKDSRPGHIDYRYAKADFAQVYVLLDQRIRKKKLEDRVDASVGITRPMPSHG